jgi:hypothetical protein
MGMYQAYVHYARWPAFVQKYVGFVATQMRVLQLSGDAADCVLGADGRRSPTGHLKTESGAAG